MSTTQGIFCEIFLRKADSDVFRKFNDPLSPPFLGLIEMEDKVRAQGGDVVKRLARGNAERTIHILDRFPNFAAWFLCSTTQENYGQSNNRIWSHIEKSFDLPTATFTPDQRIKLYNIVKERCESLSLFVPEERQSRYVDLFLLHAGVSQGQLSHLIRAFIAQERAYGLPPLEDTFTLNRWEDEALDFISDGLPVLKKPILWDATAWHAAIYVKYRKKNENIGTRHVVAFKETIENLEKEIKDSRSYVGQGKVPKARIILHEGEIALKIPEDQGRVVVAIDGDEHRLRSGIIYPLPNPLPRHLKISLSDDTRQELNLLSGKGALYVGDRDVEGELWEARHGDSFTIKHAILFSREKIEGQDQDIECHQISEGLYFSTCTLPMKLSVGGQNIALLRKASHRPLLLRGDEIGKRKNGKKLYGPDAILHVITGTPFGIRALVVTLGDEKGTRRVETDEEGDFEISLQNLLREVNLECRGGPRRLYVELMRYEENNEDNIIPLGLKLQAEVWPGFEGRAHNRMSCDVCPSCIDWEMSQGVVEGDKGSPCIIRVQDGVTRPEIALIIENEMLRYVLPPSDLLLLHILPDGSQRSIELGSSFVLDEKSRGGAVRIWTKEDKAALKILDWDPIFPFYGGRAHTVSMRELGSGKISLLQESGEKILIEFFESCAYQSVHFKDKEEELCIDIELPKDTKAVKAEIVSETGERFTGFCELLPIAFPEPPVAWFKAEAHGFGRMTMKILHNEIPAGFWFATFSVHSGESESGEKWQSLTSQGGEVLSCILSRDNSDIEDNNVVDRLARIVDWLEIRHASESGKNWKKVLVDRKEELVQYLLTKKYRRAEFLRLLLSQNWYDFDSEWMPPLYLFQGEPEIFEGKMSDFMRSGDIFSPLHYEDKRLRDNEAIHICALMSFGNSKRAQNTGEVLREFNVKKFAQNLTSREIDNDPFAGDRWSGKPLLSPAHWKAAHKRLKERLEDTNFYESKLYESRRIVLLKLHGAVSRDEEFPVPEIGIEQAQESHKQFSRTLLSFCRSSRRGETKKWIQDVSNRLDKKESVILVAIGDLIRLAPELFAFHLLLAELENKR
jgi:hypothetical protein